MVSFSQVVGQVHVVLTPCRMSGVTAAPLSVAGGGACGVSRLWQEREWY